jgi:orotate phosphoribosyltransferase
MTARDVVLQELARRALCSGSFSIFHPEENDTDHLDCKAVLSHPAILAAVGELVYSLLDPRIAAVGGPTLGADPIAMSTCQASAGTKHEIRWFSIRQRHKKHGRQKLIEGDVHPDEWVALVDDFVTTGVSLKVAIEDCRGYGLKIGQVIVLVDELSGGLQAVRSKLGKLCVASTHSIFTKEEIMAYKLRSEDDI